MKPEFYIACLALGVSALSLLLTVLDRRRARIESVMEGLRGDRRSVSYSAMHIRFANLLKRRSARQSLIASLLLAWNFETSDRARAAILASLIGAKRNYPDDFDKVIEDLKTMFAGYESTVEGGDIERGKKRLDGVMSAIKKAEQVE